MCSLNRTLYYVAEFKVGHEVSVIPDNWLQDDEESCLWPQWKSASRIDKAARNKEDADDTFVTYELSRVMYRSGMHIFSFICSFLCYLFCT